MSTRISEKRRALVMGGLGALALAGCGEARFVPLANGSVVGFGGETMGTGYTVKLAGATLGGDAAATIQGAVHAALERVNGRMSLYRDDSELARFNRHADPAPFAASPELFEVFAAADEVSRWSRGAFDVTVAPLVSAWGFGPAERNGVPEAETIATRRPAVDYRGLRLDSAARAIAKAHPAIEADLGGIAKGYGVDLAARALEARGIENFMIEVGGEIRTRGRNATGAPWRIGIEQPDAGPRRARFAVPLSGLAMATSGDYRIFFEHDGKRYSHEIDPATGRPIDHRLCSVTVVHADCMRADALATALIVLGIEEGYALAEASRVAACFIVREADGTLVDRMTPAFAALGGERLDRG